VGRRSGAVRRVLVPLALAQFICSFAGTNMNVMINDMSEDLDTTVQGIQVAAFVFQALVVAAIAWLARRVRDPLSPDPAQPFDAGGAILSAVGLVGLAASALLPRTPAPAEVPPPRP
jgi:hypothetical protein